ncbi:MAG: hypothetical protein E6H67_04615 [Betaproteobacteria bacterium]|nr:MAG: hypothetical protein E6H67_04615 [Betaproteobacteria bacterium]
MQNRASSQGDNQPLLLITRPGAVFGLWLIEELQRHGYRIDAGTLYPILHSLERRGLLRSKTTGQGRSLRDGCTWPPRRDVGRCGGQMTRSGALRRDLRGRRLRRGLGRRRWRKASEVGDSHFVLDLRDTLARVVEAVIAEHLMLELLEALGELVIFAVGKRLLPGGEQHRVLECGVVLVHEHERIERVGEWHHKSQRWTTFIYRRLQGLTRAQKPNA